jgi:hypothetical protein
LGCSQSLNTQLAVFLNGSGDRGDESRGGGSRMVLVVEMALIIGGFSFFAFLMMA